MVTGVLPASFIRFAAAFATRPKLRRSASASMSCHIYLFLVRMRTLVGLWNVSPGSAGKNITPIHQNGDREGNEADDTSKFCLQLYHLHVCAYTTKYGHEANDCLIPNMVSGPADDRPQTANVALPTLRTKGRTSVAGRVRLQPELTSGRSAILSGLRSLTGWLLLLVGRKAQWPVRPRRGGWFAVPVLGRCRPWVSGPRRAATHWSPGVRLLVEVR
ncbi:hypothetical protein SDC9_117378 [bioreactor metagenome]|uniref:Uncharacterized protein n=1 Tax=bioreactor metagenome TaxID=1076179 RepID=A0A645C504_9ZZZZ